MRPRIAVTGIGARCSVASNAQEFSEALRAGRRGLVPLEDPRLSNLRATHAGLIGEITPFEGDPDRVRGLDRNVHLALAAMRESLDNAGIDEPLGSHGAVVYGTCSGGMLTIESHYEALVAGRDPVDEDLLFSKRYYTTAKVLAWAAGASGPVLSVVTACAAGAGAIAQAADLIRTGMARRVVAGGSDVFAGSTLVGFDALKATTEGLCAPFSNPIGLNLGEGAAFLVLEQFEDAAARGAKILAEVLGSGLSNDAYHPTAPDPSARGQLAAMGAALSDAGITPEQIDYINAHGTGTRANDPAESRAISKLLKDRASSVPVSSTKSMIGHCLGGAGALEASATILAARSGFIPPTAGFDTPREGCDLDYVPDTGRPWEGRLALSNSFGFAGNNACLVLDVDPNEEEACYPLPEPGSSEVVITGIGEVTAKGLDPAAPGDAPAAITVSRFAPPAADFEAALVPEIDTRAVDRRLDLKGMDLCSRYAAIAARRALGAADLRPRPRSMEAVGLILGIASGPQEGEAAHLRAVFESDFNLQRLGHFPYVVPNEVAGNVARAMLMKGHSTVLAAGLGAGMAAAISAFAAIRLGHCKTILAAASDELSERSCSDGYKVGHWGPGTGITPSEGAAVLVVEDGETARARGANPIASILGCALKADAADPVGGGGAKALGRAVEEVLEGAGVAPTEISVAGISGQGDWAEERETLRGILGDGAPLFSMTAALGLAEACAPLFDLGHILRTSAAGAKALSAFTSPEGFAGAMLVEIL